ncbi:hypothetical protein PJ985_10850 [Streptomyces sp. ACA25]|uniref:hypothetical protein n=1 Tax=Streptomyces sp. ACA25 TaxID=3022596 RepID=UPI002306E1BD|nr:hypothetical protein [Streptomyces sp. ACA25]MDB1088063.1 hypothetical protein [Streptomyces sp. ACA25]
MASHARRPRHRAPAAPRAAALMRALSRALTRVGLTVIAAGAALGAGTVQASAAEENRLDLPVGTLDTSPATDPAGTVQFSLQRATSATVGPARDLQLNPLAGTTLAPPAGGVSAGQLPAAGSALGSLSR